MNLLFDDIIEIDELIRSRRKTISIIIDKDAKITVRAPLYASEKDILGFINQKHSWIKKKQTELIKQKQNRKKKMYITGEKFFYLGKEYPLVLKRDTDKLIYFDGGNFIINTLFKSQGEELFIKWYKETARNVLKEKIEKFSEQSGLHYNTFKINSAKSRWGSCSSKKNLNFSYRLIFTPEFVIDYIVVHELVHTKEMNHSNHFWALVEKIYPDYKKAEQWLQNNSYSLEL